MTTRPSSTPTYQGFWHLSSEAIDRADLIYVTWRRFILLMSHKIRWPGSRPSRPDYVWYGIVQTLIEAGADVHFAHMCFCWDTAYTMVLTTANTPLEADHHVWSWLDMLTDCGVLILRYIEREKRTIFSSSYYPRMPLGRCTMIPYRGNLSVPSWRYINDPAGPALALLKTFPALRANFEKMNLPPLNECQPQTWYDWSFPFCFDLYVLMSKQQWSVGRPRTVGTQWTSYGIETINVLPGG